MSRILIMFTLVVAGEIIYGLPFHLGRFFRPTLLEVLSFTNTQLGDVFAAYGVLAMICYFPGGLLADRYPVRNLMTVSLVATGAGGLYMATYPGVAGMAVLYAYWGITTILLFWAALIRATREWGGDSEQGTAFGILEGGRGLAAAAFASLAIAVFAWVLPGSIDSIDNGQRRQAFRVVILMYSCAAVAAGVLTWFVLPAKRIQGDTTSPVLVSILKVAKRPLVWAQAAVIICAYCTFRGLDNYTLYAVEVLGLDEVAAAKLGAYGAYIRPVAAVLAGLLADRFKASSTIVVMFLVLLVSYSLLSMTLPRGTGVTLIYANLLVSFFAVFALRGVYFALLEENKTPQYLTGAAAGMVSFVGYTPEIFFAPITGRILDANPGVVGHQNYFLFLAGVTIAGVIVVGWMLWLRNTHNSNKPGSMPL